MKFRVFKFKKVNSTNDTALRIIKSKKFDFGMITSESQKSGRGQYGKKWVSFKGNLFISFFYTIENISITLKQLTKINCLLVKKLLSIYYKKKIFYKRPNDLLINKKKICGILQETLNILGKKYLIVGIGINLNKNPKIIGYPTTCLNDITVKKITKSKLEKQLKKIFEIEISKLYRIRKI